MTIRQFAWLIGLGGVAVMLARVAYIQGKLLYNITYRFAQIRPLKLTASEVVLAFNMYLKNDSDIGFTIREIDVDVHTVDKVFIGNVKQKGIDAYTPPNSEGQAIPLVLTLKPTELKNNVRDALLGFARSRTMGLYYKGTISVKSGFVGVRNLPFSYTYIPEDDAT
jgi:hypothetical protein